MDKPDLGGKDGGMNPPPPPGTGGSKSSVSKTVPDKSGERSCGPKKKVTWHFEGGKRTGSTVEEWEYDGQCHMTKHSVVNYDEGGEENGAIVEGEDVVQEEPLKHHEKKREIKRHEKWVWKKGDTEPKKYRVTTLTITLDDGSVTVEVIEEPVP